VGAGAVATDKYYVDKELGDDAAATLDPTKAFKTIQACLNVLGQPVNHIDAMRTIHIYIADCYSAIAGGTPQTFDGCYNENLTVPSRRITIIGYGIKLGSNGNDAPLGNILKEYSSSRRFGATSSELRPCLTLVGLCNVRDSHQRLRNGFHVGGTCRTSILKRNLDSIQGDGANHITVHVAPGQFDYPILVSNYPTEPYIRININGCLPGATTYNGNYDITTKINATTFIATRVSGTNTNTAIETTGAFFEADSAGASGITHDSCFINTYMQGQYTCDDGTVNGAAPTAGTEVMFAIGSRFFTGMEGRGILWQRWEDNTIAGTNLISSIAGLFNCSLSGTLTLQAAFTYSTDDMGLIANRFNSAMVITLNAATTVRMDAITLKSFMDAGCTWAVNTPIINLLGQAWGSGAWASRPTINLITGQMYYDTALLKPYYYNSATTSWYDAAGVIHA
jgi:hypothetical protein